VLRLDKGTVRALRAGQAAASAGQLPILVGEANPYGADPLFALWPDPYNSAGARLQRLVLQLSVDDYLRSFERVNLCPTRWSAPVARAQATALETHVEAGRVAVLLGTKVSRAFSAHAPPFEPFRAYERGAGRLVVLPHPSGLNRAWNEPGAFERARELLRQVGVLPVPATIPAEVRR
jgi:hypothetical protein